QPARPAAVDLPDALLMREAVLHVSEVVDRLHAQVVAPVRARGPTGVELEERPLEDAEDAPPVAVVRVLPVEVDPAAQDVTIGEAEQLARAIDVTGALDGNRIAGAEHVVVVELDLGAV